MNKNVTHKRLAKDKEERAFLFLGLFDAYFKKSCLSLVFILSGCSNTPPEKTSAAKMMEDIVETQSTKALTVPAEVSDTLIAQSGGLGGQGITRSRFNVSVNQAPARTFFLSLVADSGVNVVAHPEVSGSISLELRDVSIRDVLEVTREVYGYEYKFKNGIYTIYPRKLRTEIYPINYPDIKRVGITDTSVLIGKIDSGSDSGGSQSGGSSSSSGEDNANLLGYAGQEGDSSGSSQGVSPGARVQTLNITDFWQGLNLTVTAIVGEGEGRMVMTNPQAGLVVVKALPGELRSVREFLEKSELSAKRQVVLETKILEVILKDEFEAGINWGAISGQVSMTQENSSFVGFPESAETGLFNYDSGKQSLVSTVIEVTDITKLLFFLEQQGNVQVLSSPRISTVNNQKAVIRVGSDEFFVTGLSNSTTSSASSIVNTPEVELDSFFSGIALDVTPQISASGEVIIHVHPMVTTVQDQIKEIDIAGEAFSLPLALRDIRESDSIVKAKSGQVVVLGGLMQEITSDVDTKRPFLGDVPVLNLFFKAKQQSTVKTELVILMQPIVVEDDTWEEALSSQSDRILRLSDEYRAQ